MKILLLGSSGAVGTAVEKVCKQRDIECIPKDHSQVEATLLSDLARVINHTTPTVVFNAIGIPRIQACEDNPIQAFIVNTVVVSYLTRICREKDIILVQPSTNAVFDGKLEMSYHEFDAPNPLQDYGISKLAGDYFASTLEKYYIVRFPSMYGDRRNTSPGLIDQILTWMNEREVLKIADDRIDSYTWTMDAANAIIDLLENERDFGLYHITNKGAVSLFDFVSEIAEVLNKKNLKIERAKDKDFPCTTLKPLKNPLESVHIILRPWKEALHQYLFETNLDL